MQTSLIAVIRAGVGENVLWELTQAVTSLEPQKLLILVRKMKAEDYEFFRTKATSILSVSLPERATLWRFARVSGFISFTADWRPTFLVLKAPYFRGGSFKSLAKYALRPIFENFGLEWQRPSISASTIFQVGLLFILGVIAIAAVAIIVLAYLRP
jgi:hypothetical protein